MLKLYFCVSNLLFEKFCCCFALLVCCSITSLLLPIPLCLPMLHLTYSCCSSFRLVNLVLTRSWQSSLDLQKLFDAADDKSW